MTTSNLDRTYLILVVDDDRSMRSLLNLAMEEEGYRVVEAKNGEQCLAEYVRVSPDLVLLDAVMPEVDGFTCCQRIRDLPEGDRVPILMITVLDDPQSVEQAFNSGATDYITKPIHWGVLAQRVRRLLTVNRAWLEVETLKQQLHQQQTWSEFLSKNLQQLSQSNDIGESLQQLLTNIRQWFRVSRVALYLSKQTWIESVAPECPAILETFGTDFNLSDKFGEQYQLGEVIFIKNISQANLPTALTGQLLQLKTQSLAVVAIENGKLCLGWLFVHSSQDFSQWGEATASRLKDIKNLLTIALK